MSIILSSVEGSGKLKPESMLLEVLTKVFKNPIATNYRFYFKSTDKKLDKWQDS